MPAKSYSELQVSRRSGIVPLRKDDDAVLGEVRLSGYRISGLQGRVITQIGGAIVSGRFQPGDLLPREADLLAEFGGSRPSLREAMKVLAAKGLIEMRQKVGTRVRPRDLWHMFDSDVLAWHSAPALEGQVVGESVLHDLIELRQIIEPATARLAAANSTGEDLRRISLAIETMQAASYSLARYCEADVEFHMAIFTASHNILLANFSHIVSDFLKLSFRIRQATFTDDESGIEESLAKHRKVFLAIKRGDGDAAHQAMLDVILNGKECLMAKSSEQAAKPRLA